MILDKKNYSYLHMITLNFKTSPLYSCIWLVQNIISALLPTLSIFITAHFITTAISVYHQEAPISAVYISVGLLLAIILYNYISGIVLSLLNSKRSILYRSKLIPEMVHHRANMHYRHMENTDSHDLFTRLMGPFGWGSDGPFDEVLWDMYTQVLNIVNLVVFVAGILITLTTQVWWLGIAIILSGIPLMLIAARGGRKSYEAVRGVIRGGRRSSYFSWQIQAREAFEERHIFGTTPTLDEAYWQEFEGYRKYTLRVDKNEGIKSRLGGVITIVFSGGAVLALLPPVINADMTIGMFIALVGAVFALANRLSSGVSRMMWDLTRKREYLKDITKFMALEQQEEATSLPSPDMKFQTIEFRNVHFKYPDTEKPILTGCSFTIERGKHYAFVGVNGAGKTTIAKLITGLYDNYDGEILVDGKSLREFTQAEIKGLTSVVYQDFARYFVSVYHNIALSNPHKADSYKEVEEALSLVGLTGAISKLKDGVNTPLGKILEGGIDLSGGEWQRVAMARSILSPAPLKILDEPTAALDPISESSVYQNYEKISKGKTTIFISHRLGSTKLADVIFVLSDGKIAESGSHQQLMTQNGLYTQMYNAQAKWYVEVNANA